MEVLLILAVSLLPISRQENRFHISANSSQVDSANGLCTLAVPRINFSPDRNTVSLMKNDVHGNLTDGTKLWIGYARVYQAFQYIGCAEDNDVASDNIPVKIKADPGQCFSICKQGFIGIEEQNCYCIASITFSLFSNKCSKQCIFPDGATCGDDGKGVSVYMPVKYPKDEENGASSYHLCRAAADSVVKKHVWEECSETYESSCKTSSNYTIPGSIIYPKGANDESWHGNMKFCLQKNKYPVSEETNIEGRRGKLWIGTIRSFVIREISETIADEPGFSQGYIVIREHDTLLKFSETDQSLYALCNGSETMNVSTSTPLSSLLTTSTTPSSAAATSTAKTIDEVTNASYHASLSTGSGLSSIKSSSKTDGMTVSSNLNEKLDAGDSHKSLVAVYVVVPMVLVVAAAFIGCLIWRKRNKAPENEMDKPDYQQSGAAESVIRNCIVNASYDKDHEIKSPPTSDTQHDYLVLEPYSEYAAIKDADLDPDYDENYDTTKPSNVNESNTETRNVYNMLQDDSNDTYNHTKTLDCRANETYDHTNIDENEKTYNTTKDLPETETTAQKFAGEDMYNHLDSSNVDVDKTPHLNGTYNHMDDKMGTPSQVAYAYTYTKAIPKQPVPRKEKDKLAYDYAYALEKEGVGSVETAARFDISQLPHDGNYQFAKEPP